MFKWFQDRSSWEDKAESLGERIKEHQDFWGYRREWAQVQIWG